MKRLVSGSSILLLTALMFTLSFGCGEGTEGDTGSAELAQSQTTNGTCNRTAARSMRAAQECVNSGCKPGSATCDDVAAAFTGFFGNPVCIAAFVNGESNGLVGNASIQPAGPDAGAGKHIGGVICDSVLQCGLCPFIPQEITVCGDECPQ